MIGGSKEVSMIASESITLQWSVKGVCEEEDMIELEVPVDCVTTQGVSPRRDVD
jgi:hypothetical protein